MNVGLYIRCSTDMQIDSPEVQQSLLRQYCIREQHTVADIYVDEAVSGGTRIEERPAFKRLIADRKLKHIEAVCVLKIDRLSRNLLDFLSFQKAVQRHKLPIIYAAENYEDSASGNMMMQITAMFAEFERKQTGERIRAHNRHLAQTGRWPSGRPPLGYIYDSKTKTVLVDETHVDDARAVFTTFLDTGGNRKETATRLNNMGIRTRNGNMWSDDVISDFVRNPLYRGIIRYQEIETAIDIPRIIPEETLSSVDNLLENTKFIRVRGSRNVYPYSGILVCATCGNTFKAHRGNRTNSYRYVCRGRKDKGICDASGVGSIQIDKLVMSGLQSALETELKLLDKLTKERSTVQTHDTVKYSAQKLETLKISRAKLIDLHISGIIDKVELQSRLDTIDQQMKDIPAVKPVQYLTSEHIGGMLNSWADDWVFMDDKDKRSLVLMLCSRIFVNRDSDNKIVLNIETGLGSGNFEIHEGL